MMNPDELNQFLRHAAQYPHELFWASEVDTSGAAPEVRTLRSPGTFRPGERIAIYVHPTGDGPPLPAGPEPGPHKHDFIEIAFIWDGYCRMEVEGSTVEMHSGDFLILDTHSNHNPRIAPETLLVNLLIEPRFFDDAFFRSFSKGDFLASFFADTIYTQKASKRYLIFETGDDQRIRDLFSMLIREYFSNEVCSRSIIENLVMILFSTMVRLQLQKTANITAMEQISDNLVAKILGFMQENLATITRDALARHFGYSYSYITTVLRSATGMTFSQLKNTMRLQKAEQLLRTTDRPITIIAHDAGFRNITAFYEMFRSVYGTTPTEYRKATAYPARS